MRQAADHLGRRGEGRRRKGPALFRFRLPFPAARAAVARLYACLQASTAGAGQGRQPLPLRIRVAADGAIARVGFPPFLHDQANVDLRQFNILVDLEAAPAGSSRERMGKAPEQPTRF